MDTYTHEQIEQIAQLAAHLYGQKWTGLPQWSKEIWKENVRHARPGFIHSEAERCVVAAVEQWQQNQKWQVEPEQVKPVEKKSKSKK